MAQLQDMRGKCIFYSNNSGSIAASGTGLITTSFNDEGKIYALSCSAFCGTPGATGSTAALGHLDVFKILFKRQNGDVFVTNETLGTSLFSPNAQPTFLAKPWYVKLNETLQATITNLLSGTTVNVYVNYHMITVG